MPFIQKIDERICPIPPADGFTVFGDPGCDGMGTEILYLYAQGLRQAKGAFAVVAGDIVPTGTDRFYDQISELTEMTAPCPVYMLRGNHDTGQYEAHYGYSAYARYNERTLFVVLDNAKGAFSEDSLAVLQTALQEQARPDVVLMMHIPPPNRITKKAVPAEAWEPVRQIIAASPCAGRVRYIIAGHVHSYFEDTVDGATLIVTGGAGARIAPMAGVETPYNHYVEFQYGASGELTHKKIDLTFDQTHTVRDSATAQNLAAAFRGECEAYVRYLLYAEEAEKHGQPALAALFSAAASAELIHARSFFFNGDAMRGAAEQLAAAVQTEHAEASQQYPQAYAAARQAEEGLAAEAFRDAGEAEKIHERLFRAAAETLQESADIPAQTYYTCTSCGCTFVGSEHPNRCPICGAPPDKIRKENEKEERQ